VLHCAAVCYSAEDVDSVALGCVLQCKCAAMCFSAEDQKASPLIVCCSALQYLAVCCCVLLCVSAQRMR